MLEWDEAKRLEDVRRRGLDFEDADLMFDGRPVTTAASRRNTEDRFVTTAEIAENFIQSCGMWRGKNRRIISFRRASRKRGETRPDSARAAAMTDAEVDADIASDPDEAGMVVDWDSVSVELPKPKADLHMRIDREVLDFFRKTGRGYQTRINAVLRSYVDQVQRK